MDRTEFENDKSDVKALVFLSEECPCSKSHVGHLNQLNILYPHVRFYGVVSEPPKPENYKEVETYFNNQTFGFPIINDPEQKLVKTYEALKTPHVTLMKKNKSGEYDIIYQGGVSDKKEFQDAKIRFLEEDLKLLTEGKTLKYSSGKSLGCYIRRI